ncbi:MAG: alpha/beta fold hydrolase [Eubacterium sp.]|nr:alpha/beta fold hydrolase [Eubacterium sp.]
MVFHTFGNISNTVMMLIHGMLTPWQIWEDAAEYFSGEYFVVVPELDAHTEDEPTGFCSVEEEAEKIREYALEHFGGKISVLCGLSMGGRIAADIAAMPDIHVDCLVLDGAPLVGFPHLLIAFLKKSYVDIVRKSKMRDPKTLEDCKRVFLPERYMDSFLKIADNFSEESVGTIMESVFSKFDYPEYDPDMKILFMHGTTGNEMFSRKAAEKMKKLNPQTEIRCFSGYAHAQLACFEIGRWTETVADFLERSRE